MIGIIHNRTIADDRRRESLFAGHIYMEFGRPGCVALCRHADAMIREAFGDLAPEHAHESLDVSDFILRAGPLKAAFTNGSQTRELVRQALREFGCDPDQTYFDLPRLRIIPSVDYLTSGVSYNYQAHRDTWYAHPQALVNFWMPVYGIGPEAAMSMYPAHFDHPVVNRSCDFDYGAWVANERFRAAEFVSRDTRPHPLPDEPFSTVGEFRVAGETGDVMIFSGHHLHASAPNQSGRIRFSVDFRTINLDDLKRGAGPRNIDNSSTGSTLSDFLRVGDFAPLALDPQEMALVNLPRALDRDPSQ